MNIRDNERNQIIIKYNLIGIGMNLVLAVLKITIGILANAHAVLADGINSLSDTISSGITVVSARFAGIKENSANPLGYGRLEYLSSFIVTAIIMYVGVTTIIQAVKAIISPHEPPRYSTLVIVIMVISLICKLGYGVLMRRRGKSINSASMIMSGTESMGDALISVSILAAIGIYRATGMNIEHYLCIAIAGLIIYTGINMLKECMIKLLGSRVDPDTKKALIDMIVQLKGVLNVSNLILHNYGECRYVGSVDIEVDSRSTAEEISRLSHRIKKLASQSGVEITSVGINSTDLQNPAADDIRDRIIHTAIKYKSIKRLHSFIIDLEEHYISFYIVPDFSIRKRDEEIGRFVKEITEIYPDTHMDIHKAIDM